MTINIVNPFKSQTAKTFGKSKNGQDVHAGEHFHSAGVSLDSGKKIFKFGTITTAVDDSLSKPKPLEHVKAVQSPSLFNVYADIPVDRQKKLLSKVKSAKNNISKLFKPTGRVSAAVPCIDPFVTPSVEHSTTDDHSPPLSSPSILQHGKPKTRVVTAYESTLPRHTSLKAIASPIAYGENIVNEHIEDLATFCSLAGASFPSSTGQLLTTPESQLGAFPSTFFLGERHTIEEEHGSTEVVVGVVNTEQKELATSGSYISRSNSDSGVTVYLSSDTFSDHTTTHGVGLVSSETSTSPADTSFATSVDAEDSQQFLPSALRGLRRVPNYEDLRGSRFKFRITSSLTLFIQNLQIVANRDFSCSDMSYGSSDCDFLYGAASGIDATPPGILRKHNNLRKPFLSLELKSCTLSTRQMNKYKKFWALVSTRCHESSYNTHKMSASRAQSGTHKVTPVSRSRQFLQNVLHPSSCVQTHAFKPPPRQPSPPSSPPVWSCAKITRSSSNAKRRPRVTKKSMKELKMRLDSMGIDPWY